MCSNTLGIPFLTENFVCLHTALSDVFTQENRVPRGWSWASCYSFGRWTWKRMSFCLVFNISCRLMICYMASSVLTTESCGPGIASYHNLSTITQLFTLKSQVAKKIFLFCSPAVSVTHGFLRLPSNSLWLVYEWWGFEDEYFWVVIRKSFCTVMYWFGTDECIFKKKGSMTQLPFLV